MEENKNSNNDLSVVSPHKAYNYKKKSFRDSISEMLFIYPHNLNKLEELKELRNVIKKICHHLK